MLQIVETAIDFLAFFLGAVFFILTAIAVWIVWTGRRW